MIKKVLVVAAHPDDEVLGCGGTIAYFASSNALVHVIFMTNGVSARLEADEYQKKQILLRKDAAYSAAKILGISEIDFGDFPDNRMDMLALLDVIQYIEKKIFSFSPDLVLTHHAGDLNIDHRITHQATVTACRPYPGQCVRSLLFFEVPSSTEWQMSPSEPSFIPNWYVDISDHFELRNLALKSYDVEIRQSPHSRSYDALNALVTWRGANVGVQAAEAFMLGRYLQK